MAILQLGSLFFVPSSSPTSRGSNLPKSFPSLAHCSISNPSRISVISSRVVGNRNNEIASVNKVGFGKSRISCSANSPDESSEIVNEKSVSVVLLAGGKGKRMGASMPKQYLPLLGQPIALYSFYTFSQMIEVKEIIVVCDPSYQDIFEDAKEKIHVDLKFALPGRERQDSVYSGLLVHT